MRLPSRRLLQLAAGAAAIASLAGAALAQSYPTRTATIIVPFAAGGPTDIIARLLGERLQASLGQPFIVENVTGAAGTTGVGRAVRAPADGYTFVLSSISTHVFNGVVYKLAYDVINDFEPVALVATSPMVIIGRKSLPASNLKELVEWFKANPDKGTQGFYGIGNISHVGGVYFQKETGARYAYVSYRGSNPAMQDLLAGQIDIIVDLAGSAVPQIQAGTIKGFAVMGKTRLKQAPDVPTTDEVGMPGLHMTYWNALWAPKGTPKDAIRKVNAVIVEALADPKVRKRLEDMANEIPPREQMTPEALGALQRAEADKWWPIIRAANIKVE
jgi:tripartite-type tricarboxylate transporter receptor subunit TctC